jgi:uncharacterized protein YndB with AHSA1/START domain
MAVVVSKEIAASPEVVWAMVSDLTRMGEWSPENKGGEWAKGATGPAVGAIFKGRNSNGKKSWSTTVKVTEFEPSKKISFALMVGPSAWCDWVWEVAPSATGTLVTHSWIDRRGKFANWLGGKVSGVTDRASHNRANMERTLDALAGAVHGS